MATYTLNDSKMFSDIADGIAIIINSETGIYYGMNGLGTVIFENLLNGAKSEDISAALRLIEGVPAIIEERLDDFIKKLIAYEILIINPDTLVTSEVEIDSDIANADKFEILVSEFDDAKEMLLADPIHEVKVDSGWQPDKDSLSCEEQE